MNMDWKCKRDKVGSFDFESYLVITSMRKIVILLFLLIGLGFGKETIVYVGSGSEGIFTLKLDEKTGALTDRKHGVKANSTGFQELNKQGTVIFSVQSVEGKGGVASYAIDGETMTLLSAQTYEGRGLCHVSLDQENRVLFGADYGAGSIVSFPVSAAGKIEKLASFFQHEGSSQNPKRQKEPHAHSAYVGPDNRFVYAPDLGIDQVKFYSFDPKTAKMKDQGGFSVPPGSGCRHMKFGKDGRFAHVLNELTLSVTTFSRDLKTGELQQEQTVSVFAEGYDCSEMTCSEIRVSQDGKFIYTANRDLANRGRDSISVLSVHDEGTLQHLQTAPAKVWIPRNINLSPSGDWLLVAGQKSHEVTSHRINKSTGKIQFSGHRAQVPVAMCINFSK